MRAGTATSTATGTATGLATGLATGIIAGLGAGARARPRATALLVFIYTIVPFGNSSLNTFPPLPAYTLYEGRPRVGFGRRRHLKEPRVRGFLCP